MWKKIFKNSLPNNPWVKGEIKKETRKNFELNENENTTYKNVVNATNGIFKWKLIILSEYFRKEGSQLNNFSYYLKKLEKKEQKKHTVNKRKEIIKIRTEINEIEN